MSLLTSAPTVPERLASLTLRGAPRNKNGKGGGISVELQPRKGWREKAVEGIASMRYRISATAEIEGQIRYVNVYLSATHNNELQDLGNSPDGKPFLLKNEDGSLKLCPRAGNGSFDSAGIAIDSEGKAELDESGMPVFTEPAIIDTEGNEFNLCYGTLFFVPSHQGLTLELLGVSLHERVATEDNPQVSMAPDGRPYIDVHSDDVAIVPRVQFVPKGGVAGFGGCMATKQSEAACKTAAVVTEALEAPVVTSEI